MRRPLPRPSRHLTPQQFYHDYLPELVAALSDDVRSVNVQMTIGASLHEVGEFSLVVRDGVLHAKAGLPPSPHLSFASNVDSFRLAMFDLLPQILTHLERVLPETPILCSSELGDRIQPELLRNHPGRVVVDYVDDAGDEARVEIIIADGHGPYAHAQLTDRDLWTLIESQGRIRELLRSRVTLAGDVAYVLRLAALIDN